MELTYQGLRFELPLDGVIQAEDFQMNATFNSHATVNMLLLMDEESIESAIHGLWDGANIKVYEDQTLIFSGKLINAQMVHLKGLHYLKLSSVSYTYDWDLESVSQSFLNLDATYKQVMDKVLKNQKNAEIMDCISGGGKIPDFLLQYEETDWEFLERLASHFQSMLVPDYTSDHGRVFFGIPNYVDEVELQEETYQIVKDMNRFYQVNISGDLLSQEMMKWEVQTNLSFTLAQRVKFRKISTIVTGILYRIKNGELCKIYELSRERGCLSKPIKNKHINGMSIPATVKERSGNCIRVHFHIDKEYDASPNTRYFTYAIESSFIYCMPEVGSQVHIYFPSDDERFAIAVHALRLGSVKLSGKSTSSGSGYAQKPEEKSFSNVNGAELLLTPKEASMAAEKEKSTIIKLETEGKASIKGTVIDLDATMNFSMGEPLGEGVPAVQVIKLEGKNVTFMVEKSGFTLTEEAKIVSALVKISTSDSVAPPEEISYQKAVAASTAGIENDKGMEEYLANTNNRVTAELVAKYEEGRNKVFSGAVKVAATVTTVVVVVVVTYATVGAGTAPTVAALGTVSTASATAATTVTTSVVIGGVVCSFAAADFEQGLIDVRKSFTGDLTDTEHAILDGIFGGDELAYNIVKTIADITFGIVTGKAIAEGFQAMAAMGKFYKFACGSKEVMMFKTAYQMSSNVIYAGLQDLAQTGKIHYGNIGFNFVAGLIEGTCGSALTNSSLKLLGFTPDKVSRNTIKIAQAALGTLIDTGLEAGFNEMLGRDYDIWEILGRTAFANALSTYIADPVDAVTGGYIVRSTDFILSSIPSALKLERVYNTTNQKCGAMGKGWTFNYDSRIYRNNHDSNQVYVETITGHTVLFEHIDELWINKTKGTARFTLQKTAAQDIFILNDIIDHTDCVYNIKGQLVRVDYPNNQRMKLIYNDGGLSRMVTPLGNVLEFVSENGRILQITDEIGRRIQYRYEADLLTDVVHIDEGITHYEYDNQGYICSVTDQNGVRYLDNFYDERGRIIRQVFINGVIQKFTYDDRNRRNAITYSETGKTEVYEYNKELLTERCCYEDGSSITYEYSEDNFRTSQTSRTGAKTTFVHDEYGRLRCKTEPDGYQQYYDYDENDDLVREWDTEQRETCYHYDGEHNQVLKREKMSDFQWRETKYEYDVKGREISNLDGLGNRTVKQYDDNRAYPSRVTTPRGEETKYEYDLVGRRMSVENTYGTIQLGYNSRNFITGRTDAEGHTSQWVYDRMGNLKAYYSSSQWEKRGSGHEFQYDFLGRQIDSVTPLKEHRRVFRNFDGKVTKEIHPVSYQMDQENGEGTRYEYDFNSYCIRIRYPDGGTERRFYDADGNLVKQVLPESYNSDSDDGIGYTYWYDGSGRLILVSDPEGNELHRYEYNGRGQMIWELDGEGTEVIYCYNGLGQRTEQRISIRKEKEQTWYRVVRYDYDNQGNKILEAYGKEEVLKDQDAVSWDKIRFGYDSNNHLSRVEDEYGARVHYEYDCLGNLNAEEYIIDDEVKRRIRYRYNKNGWRIQKEETINGNGDIRRAVTQYEHDKNGNVIRIKTPRGSLIQKRYDDNDRLVEEQIIDKKNGINRKVRYAYDAAGNLLNETVIGAGDIPDELRTAFQYDLKNRLTHTVSSSGAVTRYLYNRNNHLIKEIRPYGYEPETDDGNGITYEFDCRGNRIRKRNELNQIVEEWEYNLQDQPVLQRDGLGNQTEYSYLPDEQIKEIRRNTGKESKRLQSYEYNARGQIIGIVDGVNESIRYDVDHWGRITCIGFSDGVKESYEYTPSGQIRRSVDGNGHAVSYQYNSQGKVSIRTDQAGDGEVFRYDEDGNLILFIDRDGKQISRSYNVFGNLVYERAVDEKGENPVVTTCRYDSIGRLVRAICDGHSYEYEYDAYGRLKEKRSSGKRLVSYEYDKAGQMTSMTDPQGNTTRYEYDPLGRLDRMYTDNGVEVRYEYDCMNQLSQIRYGNGVITSYLYDADGNIKHLETRKGEGVLLSFAYEYDGNGNRVKKQGVQRLGDLCQPSAVTYQYDVRGQLLEERRVEDSKDETTLYRYDAAGNRVRKSSTGGDIAYGYNEKNQLIYQEGTQGKTTFTYSRQGSILLEEGPKGIREFAYNSKNQQVKVKCGNGHTQENRYDAEGLRHEMKENEKLLRFVYHKGQLLYEGGIEEKSYHLGYGIDAERSGVANSYYHRDEQLSTALTTGGDGGVQNYYQYDAFGILLENGEKHRNRIRYTGQQHDVVTGQYYLRARYYNPIIGRFAQEDLNLGDGLNLYAYCSNNPVMYYDPSGFVMEDSDYAKIMYDTDGQGSAYYQNKTHSGAMKNNEYDIRIDGGVFQSHHLLQGQWASVNLKDYGYSYGLAPTISLGTNSYTNAYGETVKGPHNTANTAQGWRRDYRGGGYSTTLNSELVFGATDLLNAGLSEKLVMSELERNYKMLDLLNKNNATKIQSGELELLDYDRKVIGDIVHEYAEELEKERMKQLNC